MTEKILSRHPFFKDMEIDKPPMATHIFNAIGEPIYTCPHCKAQLTDDDTDVLGAEDGCCFCNHCNREFEM